MIEATANVQLDQPRLLAECNAALLATASCMPRCRFSQAVREMQRDTFAKSVLPG